MTKSKWYAKPLYAVMAVAFVLGLMMVPAMPAATQAAEPVKVMTQNLYVGSDIFKVMQPHRFGVPGAVAEIFQDIVNTNFPERAQAIADDIDLYKPHLIGLQEVSLIRTQSPSDFIPGDPPNAPDVVYDYLEILLDALSERGLEYEVAAVIQEADVELPMWVFDDQGNPIGLDDARLTDRDVILSRSDVTTSNNFTYNYQANMTVAVGDVAVKFLRGFVAVDAEVDGASYRFVNTHLEVQSAGSNPQVPYIQALQALELTAVLEGEGLPIILVGDFNSGPEDTPLPGGFLPPYMQISLSGYADTWLESRNTRGDPGYTCCQDADLLNKKSNLSVRIDHVFVGSELISSGGFFITIVIGDEPRDKTTPSRLWPSDHAGVVTMLHIPGA